MKSISLCSKLVNLSVRGTVDERALSTVEGMYECAISYNTGTVARKQLVSMGMDNIRCRVTSIICHVLCSCKPSLKWYLPSKHVVHASVHM